MFLMAVEAGFARCLQGFALVLQGFCKVFARDLHRSRKGFARALQGVCNGFARGGKGFARGLQGAWHFLISSMTQNGLSRTLWYLFLGPSPGL